MFFCNVLSFSEENVSYAILSLKYYVHCYRLILQSVKYRPLNSMM